MPDTELKCSYCKSHLHVEVNDMVTIYTCLDRQCGWWLREFKDQNSVIERLPSGRIRTHANWRKK